MKKLISLLLALSMLLGLATVGFAAEAAPQLVEASLVTEVLEWGETVTAIRLEYSEAIDCSAVEHSNEHPGKFTYHMVNDRDIVNLYVNDSGVKDDIQLTGRYVFLNLGTVSEDFTTYRDQIVFNTAAKTRDAASHYFLFQSEPIVTLSGKTIAPSRIETTREIRIGVDDFTTLTYTNPTTGHTLYYQLYIPKGYQEKNASLSNLPLVAHYPSGDYSYTDFNGKYQGALFTHPDALYWTAPEAQADHPAFVVTVGGAKDSDWASEFSASEMQQNYVAVIKLICQKYNVDTKRIYAISLAGGSTPMWNTILANPNLFAAQISTAYDPYHAYKDVTLGDANMAKMLDTVPGWFFAGFTDRSGVGCLGESDIRTKGERLRDVALRMNEKGYKVDVGYGPDGTYMWNGLLRGAEAEAMASAQLRRAEANGCGSMVTLYIPGTILQTMHWSWNATYSNAVVRDWLFRHINAKPAL